ncbi:uncharacterized protein [Procambarus clarkii]|uniref:uncharacterized protein n=1 Tax=Procambarus clarkii TaxID=6728 RepID=UPI0037442FC8
MVCSGDGIRVMVAVGVLYGASVAGHDAGRPMEEVGQAVGQMVGQVVDHVVGQVLRGCHLVVLTTTQHSHVTSIILRHSEILVVSSVVVDVESLFSHHLQPPLDDLSAEPVSETTPQPPSGELSQRQPTENQPRQHQTPQQHLELDNLLQGLWGDSRTTCRGLLLDLTSNNNNTHLALRLLERSGLWQLPETVVIAVGRRAEVKALLLHHSLRNTLHALYLALHHTSLFALHNASLHTPPSHPHSRLRSLLTQEGGRTVSGCRSRVWVYRRCPFCNNGEAGVQQVLQSCLTFLPLPLHHLFQESLQDFMGNKLRIVTATPYFPYVDYTRVSDAQGTPVILTDSLDVRLIYTFAAKLNFTFDIHEDKTRSWGVERNGVFSGMIGLLQREEKDFCTVTAPTARRLRAVEYLRCYPSDPFIVTSLKPKLLPKYLALIRPYKESLIIAHDAT